MNNTFSIKRTLTTLCVACLLTNSLVFAGHHNDQSSSSASKHQTIEQSKEKAKEHVKKSKMAHKEKSKKEDILLEISYLSKLLLDISGEDSLVIKSDEVMKPFLGVCSMVKDTGVDLTCITPDSQADKNGLKTGDIITAINGISLAEPDLKENKEHPYWGIMHSMKIGDVLKLRLMRAGKAMNIDATVGSLSHPAYELRINR